MGTLLTKSCKGRKTCMSRSISGKRGKERCKIEESIVSRVGRIKAIASLPVLICQTQKTISTTCSRTIFCRISSCSGKIFKLIRCSLIKRWRAIGETTDSPQPRFWARQQAPQGSVGKQDPSLKASRLWHPGPKQHHSRASRCQENSTKRGKRQLASMILKLNLFLLCWKKNLTSGPASWMGKCLSR